MDRDAFAALARKYRTLAEVRREKARTREHTPREVMRALAREFPGALRELDVLPLAELDSRAASLERAAQGEPPARWMWWMARFHSLLRAALSIKARLRGDKSITDRRAAALAVAASEATGVRVDARFALACAAPPHGRLQEAVLARLAEEQGVDLDELRGALSPRRPTHQEVDAERRTPPDPPFESK